MLLDRLHYHHYLTLVVAGISRGNISVGKGMALNVTVRLAEGLQRRQRMMQTRTTRKTAKDIKGKASIRITLCQSSIKDSLTLA